MGKPLTKCLRLVSDAEIMRQRVKKDAPMTVPSMNVPVNTQMAQMSLAVVRAIERTHQCLVMKLETYYVQDRHDNVWLVRSGAHAASDGE